MDGLCLFLPHGEERVKYYTLFQSRSIKSRREDEKIVAVQVYPIVPRSDG
jgi:hypothetical protein